jgi:Zn-dependent protease with chaperone function
MMLAHRSLLALCLTALLAVAPRLGPGPRITAPTHQVQPATAKLAPAQPAPASAAAPVSTTSPAQPVNAQAYSLPPDKLAKAITLSRIRDILDIAGSLWGLAVLWLLLARGWAAGLAAWAERLLRRRWMQGLLFFAALIVVTKVAYLPLNLIAHSINLLYGISVQSWLSWAGDHAKSLGVSLIGTPVFLLFNWIVRVSPRRFWIWIWLVSLPLLVLTAAGAPLLDPLFNQFEPLAKSHPALVAKLETVVARTGTNIPPGRIFLMKASAKTTGLNAYVSGIGSTKRIVVWDTTAGRIPDDEILFIFGHESGHYVLNHIPKGISIGAVSLFFAFWGCAALARRLARRFAARWGLEPVDAQKASVPDAEKFDSEGDGGFNPRVGPTELTGALAPEGRLSGISSENNPVLYQGTTSVVPQAGQNKGRALAPEAPLASRQGFVVLLFVLSVVSLVGQPASNAVSRYFEHQADVYGQEAIHGLVAGPQKTAVSAFNHLGEAWLEDPDPNPIIEFWEYDHPSVQTRANFALHYDPWANGGHGRFFEK